MPCPLFLPPGPTHSMRPPVTINLANFLGHTIPPGSPLWWAAAEQDALLFLFPFNYTGNKLPRADFGRRAPGQPGCPPRNNAHMFQRIPSAPNPGWEEKGFSSCRQKGSSMLRYHFVSQVMSPDLCLGLAACSLEMKDTVPASPQDKGPPPSPTPRKYRGPGAQEKRQDLPTPTVPFSSGDYLPKG